MPKGVITAYNPIARELMVRRRHGQTGAQIVDLARKFSTKAIQKLADLMDGKAGKMTVLNKEGVAIEIDIEVPATVQAKCAEILLERGYGKAPQAVLLQTDSPLRLGEGEDGRNLTVEEKIQRILQAKIVGPTVDLEASEQSEPVMVDVEATTPVEHSEIDDEIAALI